MPFTISPGVVTKEIDLTTIVPEASMTDGAFAGTFRWGPINERRLITSEEQLKSVYGKPEANTFVSYWTASAYLAYAGSLRVVRACAAGTGKNATADASNTVYVANDMIYETTYDPDEGGTQNDDYGNFIAKYVGELGNSLKVSICGATKANTDTVSGQMGSNTDTALTGTYAVHVSDKSWTGTNTLAQTELQVGDVILCSSNTFVIATITSNTAGTVSQNPATGAISATSAVRFKRSAFSEPTKNMLGTVAVTANSTTVTATIASGEQGSGAFDKQITAGDIVKINGEERTVNSVTNSSQFIVKTAFTNAASAQTYSRTWQYAGSFDSEPTTTPHGLRNNSTQDEIYVVVEDEDGEFAGANSTVLETYTGSVASGAKGEDGGSIYYKDLVNRQSRYLYWMDHDAKGDAVTVASTTAWGAAANSSTFQANGIQTTSSLTGGVDGTNTADSDKITAFNQFKSPEDVDASLLITGDSSNTVQIHCVNNIAESRKDCVAFLSPPKAAVVNNIDSESTSVVAWRNVLPSSSYGFMDSGWKYMYDKYHDIFRYIPLNGDIAGACAHTDEVRDPFWSPAGFTRGNIKGVIKLPFNPKKAERDDLYKNGVNPVVSFPGQGTVLFGDKMMLARPSAFDRINVRRLFILLEKSIARMAESFLFEFNDAFTRSRFTSTVDPFLRDIQGRGGIQDYAVVCDDSNNTSEVVDRNEFRGDIFIKPSRSINFIQLQFVAVRSGVEFSEVIGNV